MDNKITKEPLTNGLYDSYLMSNADFNQIFLDIEHNSHVEKNHLVGDYLVEYRTSNDFTKSITAFYKPTFSGLQAICYTITDYMPLLTTYNR